MLNNVNIEKLQKKLKLNVKKNLFVLGTSLMIGVSTIGCGKVEEVENNNVECIEEYVLKTIYSDNNISISVLENDNFISVYAKTNEKINYTDEFYSTLQTELSKGYSKLEIANLDSNFDFSKIDLNNIEMLHLNCCSSDFDYILLSDYTFNTVYINEVSDNQYKLSNVLSHINSDEIIVMFNYIGKLEKYNLDVNVKKNVNSIELYVSNYFNKALELDNIKVNSDNKELNLAIRMYPSAQITENTDFIVPDNSIVELMYVDILDVIGLDGLKKCDILKYGIGSEEIINYPNKGEWNISVTEKTKKFTN